MTTQRKHYSTFKIATMAGVLGASLALLFAPRSGRETRDKLRTASKNMKHKAEGKLESAKHTVEDRTHAAMEMKDRAAQAVAEGKRSAREKYEELKNTSMKAEDEETMPSDLRTNTNEEV